MADEHTVDVAPVKVLRGKQELVKYVKVRVRDTKPKRDAGKVKAKRKAQRKARRR